MRTSGTFSYISGYTSFLSFVALLAIGYNMAHGWRLKNNITPLLALTLVVGAMFTTGSRGPIYTLLAASPVILWLAATSRISLSQTAIRLCILVPVITDFGVEHISSSLQAFMERASERNFRDASAIISAAISDNRGALGCASLGHGYRNHASCCHEP